jgi:hypothetical protein
MQIVLVIFPCVAIVNEHLELGMCHCLFGPIVKSQHISFRKMYSACFMLELWCDTMTTCLRNLTSCSVGNDHKPVNKLCNHEFVFPAGRTRRKRVAVVLPTALLRNIAFSAYAFPRTKLLMYSVICLLLYITVCISPVSRNKVIVLVF